MKKTLITLAVLALFGASCKPAAPVKEPEGITYEESIATPPATPPVAPPATPVATPPAPPAVTEKGTLNLRVPHIWEIPDGKWVMPWSGACEEASIEMVDQYYLGTTRALSTEEMKSLMSPLFSYEEKQFGSSVDTDAARTKQVIDSNTSYEATIKRNPTIDDIKAQLTAGHPVISLHYGRDLMNPRHAWRSDGPTYHMMVVTGYSDETKQFITNDTELKDGLGVRYSYDVFMASLHDFNHTTKKADGPPTVLFTAKR